MPALTGPASAFPGDTTAVDTTPACTLGTRAYDSAGNEYIYMKGVANCAAGTWVSWGPWPTTAVLAADGIGLVGIAMAAVDAATKYGWFQRYGTNTIAKVDTNIVAGVPLYIDGTSGRADGTTVAGDSIYGAYAMTAPVANVASVFLNYPFCTNI